MLTLDERAVRATGVEVAEADPERVLAVLNRQALDWLGVPGQEFLDRWRAGAYDDADEAPIARLISTALLLG